MTSADSAVYSEHLLRAVKGSQGQDQLDQPFQESNLTRMIFQFHLL